MHQSPAYENRLGFFNMQGCGWLGAYDLAGEDYAFLPKYKNNPYWMAIIINAYILLKWQLFLAVTFRQPVC
jgi:hypothetical protein